MYIQRAPVELQVAKKGIRINQHISGYLFKINGMDIEQFVSTKEGALSVIEQLRGGSKNRLPYAQIRAYISALAKRGVYQTYSLPEDLNICRVRPLKNKKWFTSVDDLGPPSPKKTFTYGRCHQPNHPFCYCSLYEETALAEVNAELGEHYVISTFKTPKDIVVIPIGEFDYFRRTGQNYIGHKTPGSEKCYETVLAREDWIVSALIDAFLADEFIKLATTNTEYRITSAISDVLLNGDLNPSIPIDAIIYPSVAFRGGTNFAIRPKAYESKMKLIETETKIVTITDVVGYGIFDHRTLATLKSVSSEGLLNWGAM